MSLFTMGRVFDTLAKCNLAIASGIKNTHCDCNEKICINCLDSELQGLPFRLNCDEGIL